MLPLTRELSAKLTEGEHSPVGIETIRVIRDTDVHIRIHDTERLDGARGEQQGNRIDLFSANIKSVRVAGHTLIHEMAHYRFGIGRCQHAEAICFAMEKCISPAKTIYQNQSGNMKKTCN